jgi:hypothetical protein
MVYCRVARYRDKVFNEVKRMNKLTLIGCGIAMCAGSAMAQYASSFSSVSALSYANPFRGSVSTFALIPTSYNNINVNITGFTDIQGVPAMSESDSHISVEKLNDTYYLHNITLHPNAGVDLPKLPHGDNIFMWPTYLTSDYQPYSVAAIVWLAGVTNNGNNLKTANFNFRGLCHSLQGNTCTSIFNDAPIFYAAMGNLHLNDDGTALTCPNVAVSVAGIYGPLNNPNNAYLQGEVWALIGNIPASNTFTTWYTVAGDLGHEAEIKCSVDNEPNTLPSYYYVYSTQVKSDDGVWNQFSIARPYD